MASVDNRGYIKEGIAGLFGLLMAQGAASAKSKILGNEL